MTRTVRRLLDLLLGPKATSPEEPSDTPDAWLAGLRLHA